MNGSYTTEFCSSRVSEYALDTRARGPTKHCITLPGVNKPRGRGLARGSPLRLRLLLRLCISSAVLPPPRSLSSTSVDHNILFPSTYPCLSFACDHPRTFPVLSSSLRDCTKTADTAGRLVTRKLFSPGGTHLEVPPPSLSFLISLHLAALRSSSISNHAARQRPKPHHGEVRSTQTT